MWCNSRSSLLVVKNGESSWQRMICLEILFDSFVVVLDVSDEQSTRRSKRTIVPPLQYWKNERIDYERRKSGRVDWNDFYPSLPSTLFFLSSFLAVSSPFYFNFASGSNDSLVPTMSQVSQFVTITVLPPHYSHSSSATLQSQFFCYITVDCAHIAHIKRLNYTHA